MILYTRALEWVVSDKEYQGSNDQESMTVGVKENSYLNILKTTRIISKDELRVRYKARSGNCHPVRNHDRH